MRFPIFLLALACALLAGCGETAAPGKVSADGYRDLDWSALLPPQDVDVLKRLQQAPIDHSGSMKAQQVGTFNTVAALDGAKVRIPGFIVPLEADDQGRLTEFFLVPFLGACIHVPPPPPNQIVYVKLPHGVEAPEITDPYGVKGVLRTHKTSNDLAGSAYVLEDASIAPWQG